MGAPRAPLHPVLPKAMRIWPTFPRARRKRRRGWRGSNRFRIQETRFRSKKPDGCSKGDRIGPLLYLATLVNAARCAMGRALRCAHGRNHLKGCESLTYDDGQGSFALSLLFSG